MSIETLISIAFFGVVTINAIYKINKTLKVEPKIVSIEVIDNHAQWVYDSKIYHANVVDGKVDNATIKRIEM